MASTPETAADENGQEQNLPEPTAPADAAPTTPEGDKGPSSLLDAIRSVVPADDAESEPAAPEGDGQEAPATDKKDGEPTGDAPAATQDDESDDDDEVELTEQEMRSLPAKSRKRIKQLLRDRARYREGHDRFERMAGFMREANITHDAANAGFDIMAALGRGDDKKFLEMVLPFVDGARARLGEASAFPDDLQAQIDEGDITVAAARTIVRDRALREQAEARAAQVREAQTRREAADQTRQLQGQIQTALEAWEAQVVRTDPSFDRKRGLMKVYLDAEITRLQGPVTPQAAVELSKRAHAWATEQLAPGSVGARSNPTVRHDADPKPAARAEPNSLLEAVQLGLGRAR